MLPKKHLGQHFLTSIPARIAMVKAGDIDSKDTILEIGPGKGFLTQELLDTGAHIIALEKDAELIPLLKEKFFSYKNLKVIEGDVLTFEPTRYTLGATDYKLIANIPYYITGAIIERFLSSINQPSQMVILIQKEVAERIVARDKKESILSLAVKAYGEPKIITKVNKGSFNPIPKVDSAVLSIQNISRNNFSDKHHEDVFFKLIKIGFSHKRKFLLSNLQQDFSKLPLETFFTELHISPKIRAEDLTLATWLLLSKKITAYTTSK